LTLHIQQLCSYTNDTMLFFAKVLSNFAVLLSIPYCSCSNLFFQV
jgi:hypothetical protein